MKRRSNNWRIALLFIICHLSFSTASAQSDTLTIAMVGDVMMGTTFPSTMLPENEGKQLFKDAAPVLKRADLTVGNLEGTLCDGGRSTKGSGPNSYSFRTPTSFAPRLKEVGFDFIHTKKLDLANVNLRAEAGVNLVGNLVLTKSDMESAKTSTAIYESLRDTELSLNWFYGVSASAKFWKWGISHDVNLPGLKLNNQGKIFSCAMAPTFSDVKAKRAESSSNVNAEAKVSCPAAFGGRCIQVDAGFVMKDEDGDDVSARLYSLNGYNGSQGEKEMKQQFTSVPTDGKKYKVYPHIKWMGVDILASPAADVEGETTCPDANHPHWIDLGIGTLWRCCNEGANSPEEYGGYYNYDEAQAYNPPSLDQIKALLNNCSYTWTTQNGVKGGKFTGPNGESVFLPAAGSGWDGQYETNGSLRGFSWSSTHNVIEYYDYHGYYYLWFNSSDALWGDFDFNRNVGLSVRPVR